MKQVPRALSSILDTYLKQEGFKRGILDTFLYIKLENENHLTIVAYIDDIIFRGSINTMCQKFSKEMRNKFEMSMLGELSFFLGRFLSPIKVYLFHKPSISRKCSRNSEWKIVHLLAHPWS